MILIKTTEKNDFSSFDHACMQRALQLASTAAQYNEVPVGAVLVTNYNQKIIGEGYNQPITTHDPTAHAEIIALRQAALKLNNYRLIDTTLYVTLEPCAMCTGAMLHARIQRLVFATSDPRTGAIGGAINLLTANKWNHSIACAHGLLATECGDVLRAFFRARR